MDKEENKEEITQKIKGKEELFFAERKKLKENEKEIVVLKEKLRRDTLELQYTEFISNRATTTQDSVYLNYVLLEAAIASYYYDIHRYKDFAAALWANKCKQAAYTIKWIVKFRPIQIKEQTKNVTTEIFDINLKFALVCGFSFLGQEIIDLIMNDKIRVDKQNETKSNEEEKDNSFYDKLLYDLRYRQLSGKKLILAFEALELVAKKTDIPN
jgi:hypothetical protein